MATNEILQFASTNTGTNLLTQSEYAADSQRTTGNQPGIARSKLVNKSLRQTSTLAAGLAQFIADRQANNITDSLTPAQVATYLYNAIYGTFPVASTTVEGKVELATATETQAGNDTTRAVTPSGLVTLTTSEDRAGLIELATLAEALAGSDAQRAITPYTLWQALSLAMPAGSVLYLARSTAPTGFLKANGAAVSRTAYAALFSAIGTTFGSGDGSTTFNLPDLRGVFARGWDDGRGVDSGRALGTTQLDALQNITGTIGMFKGIEGPWANGAFSANFSDINEAAHNPGYIKANGYWDFDASRVVRTASETRPRNIALLACIKY